jgi:hypothetical protein
LSRYAFGCQFDAKSSKLRSSDRRWTSPCPRDSSHCISRCLANIVSLDLIPAVALISRGKGNAPPAQRYSRERLEDDWLIQYLAKMKLVDVATRFHEPQSILLYRRQVVGTNTPIVYIARLPRSSMYHARFWFLASCRCVRLVMGWLYVCQGGGSEDAKDVRMRND